MKKPHFLIRTNVGLVAGVDRLMCIVQLEDEPAEAKPFRSRLDAQAFINRYGDAGFGLTKADCRIEQVGVAPADVSVLTSAFFSAHLHEPRGRGLWMFKVGGETFEHHGLYLAAKKAAVARACALGVRLVEVLP